MMKLDSGSALVQQAAKVAKAHSNPKKMQDPLAATKERIKRGEIAKNLIETPNNRFT